MDCPICERQELKPQLTAQGVEVDQCPSCGGMWLDKGEIYRLVSDPIGLSSKLNTAYQNTKSSDLISPRSGEAMDEVSIDGIGTAYRSPHSDGFWASSQTLYKLLSGKAARPKAPGQFGRKGATDEPEDAPASRPTFGRRTSPAGAVMRSGGAAAEKLMGLPNLGIRTAGTLIGLYGLLTVVVIAATQYFNWPLEPVMATALIGTVIQFALAPILMDLSLRWFYNTRFVEFHALPPHLQTFANKVAKQNDIKTPRFAIMDDGAPQAFTYGHIPSNARIVLSRGLMELLDEEELEAVTAHEMGHAIHWDILLMTFAQIVPLILYYVYRTAMEGSKGKGKKSSGNAYVVIGAYVLYILSEYVVLWFSRTREYHADRFAGNATGKPATLSSALAKIGYGLAARGSQDQGDTDDGDKKKKRDPAKAIGALGIFDADTGKTLAITSQSSEIEGSHVDKDALKRAMRWDLWNPWAGWYELNSTHPLIANRLEHLANQSRVMGQEAYITFNDVQPESYWDEFGVDLFMHLLPLIGAALGFLGAFFVLGLRDELALLGWVMLFGGPCLLLRLAFTYRGDFFPAFAVAGLLKVVKVSSVRPVPCTLKGTIIGRGVPGYIASEDFVMRDETGHIFVDYRQPLAIWEFLFGLLKAEKFHGQEVIIEGWYRRAPVPYIEIKSIELDGDVTTSWYRFYNFVSAVVISFAGVFLALGGLEQVLASLNL